MSATHASPLRVVPSPHSTRASATHAPSSSVVFGPQKSPTEETTHLPPSSRVFGPHATTGGGEPTLHLPKRKSRKAHGLDIWVLEKGGKEGEGFPIVACKKISQG